MPNGGKQWVKQAGKPVDGVAASADIPTLETIKNSKQLEMGVVQPEGIVQLESDVVVEHREEHGKHSEAVQLKSDIIGKKKSLEADNRFCPVESLDGLRDLAKCSMRVSYVLGEVGKLSSLPGPVQGLHAVRLHSMRRVWDSVRQWKWTWWLKL